MEISCTIIDYTAVQGHILSYCTLLTFHAAQVLRQRFFRLIFEDGGSTRVIEKNAKNIS